MKVTGCEILLWDSSAWYNSRSGVVVLAAKNWLILDLHKKLNCFGSLKVVFILFLAILLLFSQWKHEKFPGASHQTTFYNRFARYYRPPSQKKKKILYCHLQITSGSPLIYSRICGRPKIGPLGPPALTGYYFEDFPSSNILSRLWLREDKIRPNTWPEIP